ncbi:MAG: mechanosensitive ion channel family protein [candidate division NC10 bacterium]|nr:mechanosensitive ion channel family protein [candidate division NC10 bacterium]
MSERLSMGVAVWALPLSFLVGGILLGVIFDRVILNRLEKVAARTKWKGDSIIIAGLRGMTILWLTIAGAYGAILNLPLSPILQLHLEKILLVMAILSVTAVLARITVGFVRLYAEQREGLLPSTSIFVNLTRALIYLIGLLIVLQSLGVSITPMLTALGVGGLAVALALQDTLANLFSGLHIVAARQVRPGDYVKLESGEEGFIADITWRNTNIRSLPNNMVVVPNSKLASAIITNYSLPETEMAVLVQVGVSYDSDLARVEEVTIEVAKEIMNRVPGGVPEFEPFIRYHTFADFSINFSVIMRAREFVGQYLIKHEFVKRLHQRYKEEGIRIPFPIRTVYMEENKQ